MNMPHISVMIPVYNRVHLIDRTIESVLNQQFQDWDMVVVDDASQDNTIEVVSDYSHRDSRIRLVVNDKNLGLTRNWNRCLELATGPLVQILQSDDLIDPDYLMRVSEVFEGHPQLGFVAASCRYIDINDHIIHPGTPQPPALFQAGDEAVTAILGGRGHPHVSSIVMQRQCYERLGGFNEEIWHGPDTEMDPRLAAYYDYYHCGRVYTSFRRHSTNMARIEFFRKDFLQVQEKKLHLAWSYLSPNVQRCLGIDSLDRYIAAKVARTALTGATIMLTYGQTDLMRYYIRQALRYDPRSWLQRQFWKSVALAIVPGLGKHILQHRLQFSNADRANLDSHRIALLKQSSQFHSRKAG